MEGLEGARTGADEADRREPGLLHPVDRADDIGPGAHIVEKETLLLRIAAETQSRQVDAQRSHACGRQFARRLHRAARPADMRHAAGIEDDHGVGRAGAAERPAQDPADERRRADRHGLLDVVRTAQGFAPAVAERGSAGAGDRQGRQPAGAAFEHGHRDAIGGRVAHQQVIVLERRDAHLPGAVAPDFGDHQRLAVRCHQHRQGRQGCDRLPPVQRRQVGQRLVRQAETGDLAPLGETRFTADKRCIDHPRHHRHLAHIGLAGSGRRQQRQARNVIAPCGGQRRQQRAQPEADEHDIGHAAVPLQPVDRRADAGDPALNLARRRMIAGGVAATRIVEQQGRQARRGRPVRQQPQEAAAAQILVAMRAGDDDAALADRFVQPADRIGEDDGLHATLPTGSNTCAPSASSTCRAS